MRGSSPLGPVPDGPQRLEARKLIVGQPKVVLEAGEELAVVSRSLGHANISTPADVYAHITPALMERSAARMDAILGHEATA